MQEVVMGGGCMQKEVMGEMHAGGDGWDACRRR